MSLDDLCANAARIGLQGIDLVDHNRAKARADPRDGARRRGYPERVEPQGAARQLEKEMRENIERAAAAKVPNVITFSGNRRGMSDEEGKENTILGLNRVKKMAEDNKVTICLELLNSKVDHKDYMCDHTAWAWRWCKQVDSPHVKLLYDIYHMQIMEGDIIRTIRENIRHIGAFPHGRRSRPA